MTDHGRLCDDVAEAYDRFRPSKLPVEIAESTEEVAGHVRTTSAYLRLDAERRGVLERSVADLIEAPGGTCRSSHFATLVTARAAGPRT